MKTKNCQRFTQNAIPNGEGFNALPVSFKYVVARSGDCDEAISSKMGNEGGD